MESRNPCTIGDSGGKSESAAPVLSSIITNSSRAPEGASTKTVAIRGPAQKEELPGQQERQQGEGEEEEAKQKNEEQTRRRNEPNCIYCGQPVNESLCHVTPSGYAIRNLHEVCHQAIMLRANEVLEATKNGRSKLSLSDLDRLDNRASGDQERVPLLLQQQQQKQHHLLSTEANSVRAGKDQYFLDWRVLEPGETFHWVREIKRGTLFRRIAEQEVITDRRCFRVDVNEKRITSEVPIAGVDTFITVSGNAGSPSGSVGDLHFMRDGKEALVFPNVSYPTELKKMIETLKQNASR